MSQYDRRDREQDDWAEQVPWERDRGPYRDYGWERGESVLPEFRDPSVHIQPYERRRVSRWNKVDWNKEYDYGVEETGPYAGIGPKGYQRSDERIFEDVCERLTQAGQIDARDIHVNVKDGEVTLDGAVRDRQTKRRAEMVADTVYGVKDVHNKLHIQQRDRRNESGMPGGGQGRVDRVGGSGVYPASGPYPEANAPVQGEASWGQGERGAAGYEDSGTSELNIHPENQGKSQEQNNPDR
jgi:BON domain